MKSKVFLIYFGIAGFVVRRGELALIFCEIVEMQIVQKTFELGGDSKAPNLVAGEILSFFTRNNFSVADRGETIT